MRNSKHTYLIERHADCHKEQQLIYKEIFVILFIVLLAIIREVYLNV